ncbi:MAG: hypothetical protein PHU85_00195 [Phycisphaerae bacterium]|nr:hypothetical protein [Phycisphaerae bacterium]
MRSKNGTRCDRPTLLTCSAPPAAIELAPEPVDWIQAAEGDPDAPKRFSMVAYTGGPMRVSAYMSPIVVDLAGLKAAADEIPNLLNHDLGQIVGHSQVEISAQRVKLAGVISGGGPAAQEVLVASRRGFPWKASIGARPEKVEYVEQGASAKANGRTFQGPVQIIRAATLFEVSFVAVGADARTNVNVAAAGAASTKERNMDPKFSEWLKANGYDTPETLSEQQLVPLRAAFDAAQRPPAGTAEASPKPDVHAIAAEALAEFRKGQAAETDRVARIRKACAGRHPEIEAKAIADGASAEAAELEVLRAERPKGPAIHGSAPAPDQKVLEAGILLAVMADEGRLVKAYGDQVLEQAHKFRRIRFKELMRICCAIDGHQVPQFDASSAELVKAAFSTVSLPGILSNVGHKVMLEAYTAVPALVDLLCKRLSASDFKTHTGYRLSGDFTMREVAPDGELEHATVDEATYTYAVKTYGRYFGLTRQMEVNDDLGAFAEIPRMIGRGAVLMKERLFWTLVHANTGNFFHSNNSNLITKVLGSVGLGLAAKALEEQTDDQGDPILVSGRYLVVPPALHETADELYQSTNLNTGGAATAEKVPNRNRYAGRYEPQASPYLGNTSFHASASDIAWYLWGDPADVAAFGAAYLNGVAEPVVEEVELSGQYLGRAWRGYLDFGVCQADCRGAVKSTGATA